jgi:hypothetical protein
MVLDVGHDDIQQRRGCHGVGVRGAAPAATVSDERSTDHSSDHTDAVPLKKPLISLGLLA